jgi:HEAT repeat protein/cyclophilin family peptidyl-prolyl cis-trans isomerase
MGINMQRRSFRPVALSIAFTLMVVPAPRAQTRRPLADADIDAIARILKLEDTRTYDEAALSEFAKSPHPEVRRRAAQAVGRINDPRGRALLGAARSDTDVDVLATVAFSAGQLKDNDAVSWLGDLMASPRTPRAVAREAARSLGKIQTPEARAALAAYLGSAPASAMSPSVVGEALFSIGRFTARADLSPVVKWATSRDVEVRWRAAWALFRVRNPDAARELLRLASDPSAEVRFWAVRGLVPAVVDTGGVDRAAVVAKLRAAVRDPDRRVRTEAVRALVNYTDDESLAVILAALDSADTWLSVSAAEGLTPTRFQDRAALVTPRLLAAAAPGKPIALRLTALTPLVGFAPDRAIDVATDLARSANETARAAGRQVLQRQLGEAGRERLAAITAFEPQAPLPPIPAPGRGRGAPPPPPALTDAAYRALVVRWIVPDYNGAPRPHAVWDTTRGQIEIELHPGDAPLGTDYFVRLVESNAIVGTGFSRVVPNFVAQQRTITNAVRLRDEVSRLGLTRGNLSWASDGLDTGRPGYTLGSTPQPHNEGSFTALGRVVRGMDVVDRLELGDVVTATRMVR